MSKDVSNYIRQVERVMAACRACTELVHMFHGRNEELVFERGHHLGRV
jgi:hypothetical protein